MPTNINTATNKNHINIKVVVGDVSKKRKPRRRAAPSGDDDSPPPTAPPPTIIVNNTGTRSGSSMGNRPYDTVDGSNGMEQEVPPSGLASNYAEYQASRARYFMSLQEQMEGLLGSDSTDQTVAPPNAPDMPDHGAQEPEPPAPHRAESFAAPPTQEMETQTPSALPAGPSRIRERRGLREAMLDDGVIRSNQHVTPYRRESYEHWVNRGRDPNSKPNFTSEGA